VLGIHVEFLTGRYVATAHDDRAIGEWPPHPARLFSALVATWAEAEPVDPEERAALCWLERAGSPAISASPVSVRTPVTHYVPVNDTTVFGISLNETQPRKVDEARAALDRALDDARGDSNDKAVGRALAALAKARDVTAVVEKVGNTNVNTAVRLLPDARERHARQFPSCTPDDPCIEFIWPDPDLPPSLRDALERLVVRVVRLGHSSSLVACCLTDGASSPSWIPAADGDCVLRGVGPGQVDALEAAFARHHASGPRTLPARGVRYRSPNVAQPPQVMPPPTPDLAGDWFVLEFQPPRRLPSWRTVDVTRALRGTVLSYAERLPEALSGHQEDSAPSNRVHVAFVALPFVARPHADGRIMGAAVLLPAATVPDSNDADLKRTVLRAIGASQAASGEVELRLGSAGVVRARFVADSASFDSLHRVTWARPSRRWVSVTPVALPKHPGNLRRGSDVKRRQAWARAEMLVRESCRHVGLPDPVVVTVGMQPFLAGVAPVSVFPAFRQFDRMQEREITRLQVHVALEFAEPIGGPILLGSGRYFGLGLLRPTDGEANSG